MNVPPSVLTSIDQVFFLDNIHVIKSASSNAIDPSTLPNPSEAIKSKTGFAISTVIFLLAVVLLVTHSITGLTVAFIGTFIAVITLLAAGKDILYIIKI